MKTFFQSLTFLSTIQRPGLLNLPLLGRCFHSAVFHVLLHKKVSWIFSLVSTGINRRGTWLKEKGGVMTVGSEVNAGETFGSVSKGGC